MDSDDQPRKRAREETDPDPETEPPPERKIKTLAEARNANPAELLASHVELRGRVCALITHGSSFKFKTIPSKGEESQEHILYDIFAMMPSFNFITEFTLLVHNPTKCVLVVKRARYGSAIMTSSDKDSIIPDSLTVNRIAKLIGSKMTKKARISCGHDCYRLCGLSGKFFSQAVDNFFKLSSSFVRACLLYPNHVIQANWNALLRLRNNTLPQDYWKLAFRSPHLELGPVSPMRIHSLLAPPQTCNGSIADVVISAMKYDNMIAQTWRLFFSEDEVTPFMINNKIVVEDTRRKGQYLLAHNESELARVRKWMSGDHTIALAPESPLWGMNGVGIIPMDGEYTKIHKEVRAVSLSLVTMFAREDVRAAFASFLGTECELPPAGKPFVAVFPYLEIWTLHALHDALESIEKHGSCRAILIHGNLSVANDLIYEIKILASHVTPLVRRNDCPPWIPGNPKYDPSVELLPPNEDFFTSIPIPIPNDYLTPRCQMCFVRRNHENDIKMAHLYWHLYNKYSGRNQHYGVQTFVMKKSHSVIWRKLLFDHPCEIRPGFMSEKNVAVGEKVIDARTNTMYIVDDIYEPNGATMSRSLRSVASKNAGRFQGHDVWLHLQSYSPCQSSHSACCGSLGYEVPDKSCMNMKMHYDHIVDGTAVPSYQYTIPNNFISFIFVPDEPKFVSSFLLQFIFSVICHTRRSVIVYGIPYSILQ